jgi:hypothetical protein
MIVDLLDLINALAYLRAHIATVHDCFGMYEVSTDLVQQTKAYACDGCAGRGESHWPGWLVSFEHEETCRFLTLMRVLSKCEEPRTLTRTQADGSPWDYTPGAINLVNHLP